MMGRYPFGMPSLHFLITVLLSNPALKVPEAQRTMDCLSFAAIESVLRARYARWTPTWMCSVRI
jgi:hypothetical protein